MNQAKISAARRTVRKPCFSRVGFAPFRAEAGAGFHPCRNRTKGRSPTESRNGSALCGRSRPRRRDARAARFTQALHDALSAREAAAAAAAAGDFRSCMPIAAAGAETALRRIGGARRVRRGYIAADVLSRSLIYPQPRGMLYRASARIRADGAVHHPYAVPMLYRAHTRTLWRTRPTRCRSC